MANIVEKLTNKLGLTKYSIYLMDYGAPVGFRLAVRHPERVQTLIVQNGNAYEEGLREFWVPLKAYWKDKSKKNGGRAAKPANDRRDKVAVHSRRARRIENQP